MLNRVTPLLGVRRRVVDRLGAMRQAVPMPAEGAEQAVAARPAALRRPHLLHRTRVWVKSAIYQPLRPRVGETLKRRPRAIRGR